MFKFHSTAYMHEGKTEISLRALQFILLPILLSLSCEKEVSTSPEDILIADNILFVDSDPQGAAIFVDKRNTGQYTPDTLRWIDQGDHIITLKMKLFEDFSLPVTMGVNEIDSLFFNYRTNPLMLGRIYVDSDPRGADIFLNDIFTGYTTPEAFDSLFPGQYKVGYKLTGFWDLETTVSVVSNRTVIVDKRLIDTLEWVNFHRGTAGLPTNYYNAIDIQDGYIKWIGSQDAGLVRYDDQEWTIYKTENSGIPSNKILSVDAVENGIWVGTDNGAAFFNNGLWEVYNSSNSPLQSDQINSIKVDPSGRVWMSTYNKGIYILNGGSWTSYNTSNSPLPTDFVNTIFIEESGTVWIGTYGEGLVKFDGIGWSIYTDGLPVSKNVVAVLVEGTDIWVGCHSFGMINGGIAARINNTWQTFYDFPALSFTSDLSGSIWLGTDGSGLMKYNFSWWESYNVLNCKILSNKVTGVAIDGAGDKWLATFGGGISKFKKD